MAHFSGNRWAVGRYVLAWVAAVALIAAAAVGLQRTLAPIHHRPSDQLTAAARRGGCVLRQDSGGTTPRELDVMQPPTFGPPAAPADPGVYARAPSVGALVGALRRGVIVVQYRPDTAAATLVALRARLPRVRVIVTPDGTRMRYAVAATAWGRLLGRPQASTSALAAVRAFVLRFPGTGPDAYR